MRTVVTAEQFRLIWRMAGGDEIPMPIQAPARGRMATDRDRISRELGRWWSDNEDPSLFSAVRDLRRARVYLHLEAFPTGGKPIRALLGAAPATVCVPKASVLVVQDAAAAVRDGDDRDWYPDTVIDSAGWSLERGGDIRLSVGDTVALVAQLLAAVPDFQAGTAPAMRAELARPSTAGFISRVSITSKAERIQALLGRHRELQGSVAISMLEGSGLRRVGALGWVVVAGHGGYLVAGEEAVSLRPATRADLRSAVRRLLASAESATDLV